MMRPRFSMLVWLALVVGVTFAAAQTPRHPLRLDDLARFRNVGDPQVSPDGQRVAYTVSTIDAKEDKSSTHIWMVGCDGRNDRQITFSNDSESSPRWSPDGKYLGFTSGRSSGKPGVRGSQLWLLDRSGGEAYQLTEFKGRLQGYEWSPDSKRIAVLIGDPDADAGHAAETSETNRHRSLSLQAGRAGLFVVRTAHLHLSVRHRIEKTRSSDEE